MYRDDLTLNVLYSLIEHDLSHTDAGGKLSLIVIDFLISKHKSDMWHKEKILELMKIVERHPKGNIIRFRLLFYTSDLVKPRQITANLNLRHNFLHLFEKINWFITEEMFKYGSRTTFGSYRKHVGMTSKLKNWKSEAWEGFLPSNPSLPQSSLDSLAWWDRKKKFFVYMI